MKIANTKSNTRICLTENEYRILGSPARIVAILLNESGALKLMPTSDPKSGSSVYINSNDADHPHHFCLPVTHPFRTGRKHFGSEKVRSTTKFNEKYLTSEPPAMKYLPRQMRVSKRAQAVRDQIAISAQEKRGNAGPKTLTSDFSEMPNFARSVETAPRMNPDGLSLGVAVRFINERKRAAEGDMLIQVNSEGMLEVIQKFA